MADLFNEAIRAFDAANAEDPNRESLNGHDFPRELLYAERMTGWLSRLKPDASEELRLAVRCQHIRRWTIPRSEYPMDRRGYYQWRSALKRFHASTAEVILRDIGYPPSSIERVKSLVQKERMRLDAEAQAVEDTACLVFLEFYLEEFSGKHEDSKVTEILAKTWGKMSGRARQLALEMKIPAAVRRLLEQAARPDEE